MKWQVKGILRKHHILQQASIWVWIIVLGSLFIRDLRPFDATNQTCPMPTLWCLFFTQYLSVWCPWSILEQLCILGLTVLRWSTDGNGKLTTAKYGGMDMWKTLFPMLMYYPNTHRVWRLLHQWVGIIEGKGGQANSHKRPHILS